MRAGFRRNHQTVDNWVILIAVLSQPRTEHFFLPRLRNDAAERAIPERSRSARTPTSRRNSNGDHDARTFEREAECCSDTHENSRDASTARFVPREDFEVFVRGIGTRFTLLARSRARGNARRNGISCVCVCVCARARAHSRCAAVFFAHSRRPGDDDSYSFRGSGAIAPRSHAWTSKDASRYRPIREKMFNSQRT